MKLIIDISEGDYKWIKDHVMTVNEQRIANGIPLDDVLDKIGTEIEEIETYDGLYIDRAYVLQIIDRYRNEVIE